MIALHLFFFLLTDKEIKAQRESVTYRRSNRYTEMKLGLESILSNSRACALLPMTHCRTAIPWGVPRKDGEGEVWLWWPQVMCTCVFMFACVLLCGLVSAPVLIFVPFAFSQTPTPFALCIPLLSTLLVFLFSILVSPALEINSHIHVEI